MKRYVRTKVLRKPCRTCKRFFFPKEEERRCWLCLKSGNQKRGGRVYTYNGFAPINKTRSISFTHDGKPKTLLIKKNVDRKLFYESKEWLELRYLALKKFGRKCLCCFATGVEIHVDHIKPLSLYPDLALNIDNLQTLCRACNLGKSNTDSIDWRPR